MIYFDNSATTKIDPRVVDAMLPYLYEEYGNPSSKYYSLAMHAKDAVEASRAQVAKLFGCDSDEVIFTSGATESNNLILKGVMETYGGKKHSLAVSKVEHSSILEVAGYMEQRGMEVMYINVDSYGRVDETALAATLDIEPVLVSVQWGNNETGVLNDIRSMAKRCEERGILFHTDATQVVGKLETSPLERSVRFLSLSAHKLHGPKGIGAAIIRKDELGIKTKLAPLIHGGGQEYNYRSGTLSVHNIVGFGKAAELALLRQEEITIRLQELEEHLRHKLVELFPDIVRFNGDVTNKIPGIVNVQFRGTNNELLIKKLSDRYALSTGSACSSSKPSHVLHSIGLTLNEIRSSVRISLSHMNTIEEIDSFCAFLTAK
ncbi:cysteine desulfurase family protein [Paenibacillus aurantiacus]|uniref:Cysteine desulfurase family protein n=1 Tax=Paenibacillus aurantiacus TaxID=1936118 RepID=A0ABV5KGQ7_9BACL